MEKYANTSTIQYLNMISTLRQRLEALEDTTKSKMEEMKCSFDELTNMRLAKETLLTVTLQQLIQETEKAAALEKNVVDAVNQNAQQSAQIQMLESIEAELRASLLEKQSLQHEALQNISELQIQVQRMAMKLHEVEAQLIDMESKCVITPHVQSYSGVPRARTLSADQVLNKKCVKPYVAIRTSLDRGIKRRSSKQEKSSVLKHLRHSTSPKGQTKITKSRHSTGQISSVAVEPIIVSLPVKSTPDEVFVKASDEQKIPKASVEPVLEVAPTSAVKAAVQEFEKFNSRDVTKGAIPKRRLFEPPKRRSLKQESETDINATPVQRSEASRENQHQSLVVASSQPLPDVTNETKEWEKSTKRCLSPNVCVSRVKKLRVEELKSQRKTLLPCLKNQDIPHKLQKENVCSTLVSATRREDVQTIRRMAALRGGRKLLDAPVVDVLKFTPLHLAASWGHIESARALLDSGAGLEVQDWVNSTPLHIAAFWGHAKICRLLLGRGAQIQARNCNEETPLHLAARQGHLQVVRLMVDDWWADLDTKDSTGRTPWDVAQFWKKLHVANWLSRQNGLKKRFGRQHRSNSVPCNTYSEE